MYTEKFIADVSNPYGYVYVTTNLVTGKRYCGKHKSSKYDPNYLGSGVLLKQAITQYGADYFKSAPIEWATSAEELHQKEVSWIQRLDAVNSDDWYNLIEDSNQYPQQKTESEPDYIKVYLKDICYLTHTPKFCSDVLRHLLKYVTYADDTVVGGMIINLSTYARKSVAANLGFQHVQSLTNAITELVKGKVLFKLGGGAYRLNPFLFGKGDWRDIKKLRATIPWDATGKTIKTEIERYKRTPIKTKEAIE